MASIGQYIENIRSAVFGKDVRESIAKAIEQCYEDATTADPGNTNLEVIAARGLYNTLSDREDAQDADMLNAVAAEASERNAADQGLQQNINGEAQARSEADVALGDSIRAEATSRDSADQNLQTQINEIIAPTGEAPSAAEVTNARIGADGTTYQTLGDAIRTQITDVNDSVSELDALSPIFRGAIAYTDNIDTYTTSGQWWLTADQLELGTPANWPSTTVGRLIVFGSATDSRTLRDQMVIDNQNKVFVRSGRSTGWNDWAYLGTGPRSVGSVTATGDYADLDTFPINTIASVPTATRTNFAHFPGNFGTGAMIVTQNSTTETYSGAVQTAYFYLPDMTAQRIRTSDGWSDWAYKGVRIDKYYCSSVSGTNRFANLAWGLRFMMQHMADWSEQRRCVIEVEEGTWSLNGAISYITGGTLDTRGLFLPPYCTIKGAGKEKTKLTLYSTSTDDNIMTLLSGLNMPYESKLQDLTLSVKNIRYAIHSDNGITTMPDVTVDNTKLRNNTQVTLENVRLEHLGFDSGMTPTYFAPACWGGGSFDNSNRKFVNCEFIAKQYTAWLNHNRTGLTLPSKFEFENCRFINESGDSFGVNSSYSSINLITWGAKLRNPVTFKNCYANRFLAMMPSTTSGASDSACDYNVYADNDMTVAESQTNNAHLADNYITGNCGVAYAEASITAYTPVSSTMGGGVHAYSASDPISGIALNSAAAGESVTWQRKGLIYLGIIGATGFSTGQTIGYSGGSWAVDTTNPIIKVINANIGRIIEK